jgi:hypothetical protein
VQHREGVCTLAAERREYLVARLAADGKVVAKDIAAKLGLSEDSIRRDLREMATAGYVSGSTVAPCRPRLRPPTTTRAPGSSLTASGASLPERSNSFRPAARSSSTAEPPPSLLPGRYPPPWTALSSRTAPRSPRRSSITRPSRSSCSAGACSNTPPSPAAPPPPKPPTASPPTCSSSVLKRTLASRAADTYVIASVEKIGAASRYQVIPFAAVAGIITDAPPNDTTRALADQAIPVLCARSCGRTQDCAPRRSTAPTPRRSSVTSITEPDGGETSRLMNRAPIKSRRTVTSGNSP